MSAARGDGAATARSARRPAACRRQGLAPAVRRRRRSRSGAWEARLLLAVAAAFLLAVAVLPAAARADDAEAPAPGGPRVGQILPRACLLDPACRPVSLGSYSAPVLVVNLFAFWCDTWVAELPQLRELAARQRPLGFRLVSVSIDGRWPEQLSVVCGARPLPFAVLLDPDSTVARAVGLRRVPTVLVVDRRRRITYVHEGYPGNLAVLRAVRAAAAPVGAAEAKREDAGR